MRKESNVITHVDEKNVESRRIIQTLTGWSDFGFALEIPIFMGWREQQDSLYFRGAWVYWLDDDKKRPCNGVSFEMTINYEAGQQEHEHTLRRGLESLRAIVAQAKTGEVN